LNAVLPVVKDRGAAVIGLIMDDNGIPAMPKLACCAEKSWSRGPDRHSAKT